MSRGRASAGEIPEPTLSSRCTSRALTRVEARFAGAPRFAAATIIALSSGTKEPTLAIEDFRKRQPRPSEPSAAKEPAPPMKTPSITLCRTLLLAFASALLSAFAPATIAAPGDLDATFGTGGKVITPIGSGTDKVNSVALQNDGKIVVAGYSFNGSNNDFALVRYHPNGTLDTTGFGSGGKVTTTFGSDNDQGNGVAVQKDGKIVVAGTSSDNSGKSNFALVRYNSNGTLDATGFGSGGKVTTAIGPSLDRGNGVALQSDGKIVVAGYAGQSPNSDFAVVRYNKDGSLETGFGSGGKVTTAFGGGGADQGQSVAVQSDGKIVVAGYSFNGSNDDFAVARYDGGCPGDSDADSLPDSWELSHFGDLSHGPNENPDGDSLFNFEEYAYGGNPKLWDFPFVVGTIEGIPGTLRISITKHPDVTYEVESAGTLFDDQPDSFSLATTTVLVDTATTLEVRDNFPVGTAPARYLRVRVTADPGANPAP